MRLNAPIPALLALAILCFFPGSSFARPTHRSAHKASCARHSSARHRSTTRIVRSRRHVTNRSFSRRHHSRTIGEGRRNPPSSPSRIERTAYSPVIQPSLYNKRGRLVVPPPLRGSREILVRQNQVADREGLTRIQSDQDLIDMRGERLLVPLPADSALQIDERLPVNRRYCRPWTAQFLATLARAHYAHFHTPLQVNSAVRTVEFQQHLIHINGNAAPAEGDIASPHLTGQAIDIAKHGLSLTEIAWLRAYLLPLVQENKVDVEEEFQQACFHISVYKKYLPPAATPVTSHHSTTTALATALP
ncbi:MAG: DUF5715 family protein [Edaphobacter sp.]